MLATRLKYLVSAAVVLILAGVFVAPMAFALSRSYTIDPVAIVADNGRHIVVTGPTRVPRARRLIYG
jgi:hypothetical protein